VARWFAGLARHDEHIRHRLRALREERGLPLADLAQAAGVSRRAIGMYEEGMGAMVEVAQRLEEFLDEALVVPYRAFEAPRPDAAPPPAQADISELASAFESAVLRSLQELGFRVAPTLRSPFSAITREHIDTATEDGKPRMVTERVVLTGFAADHPDAAKRAAATANLCDVTETFGVFFVERTTTRVAIEGTPVVSREELRRVDDADALIKLLEERRARRR